ncbi:MAG: glucose ABC transporter substrate-binding protein GlcS [Vulcanisaeta sp. AZ3]
MNVTRLIKTGISRTLLIAIIVVVVVVVAIGGYFAVTYKPPTPVSKTIIFYTWWATEGKIALQHEMPAIYKATGITVEPYIIPGAGGTEAKYAIIALIEAGKPPAMFQVHYGPEMISYVEAAPKGVNSFVNVTPYAQQWGLFEYAVPEVLEAGAFNGTLLSVPVNVHRGALLYVNVQLLREYNLPFPYTFSELVYDTVQLAKHGVYPWMVPGADGGWDQFNLWEDIFLSLAGPQLYNELMYGTINLTNPTVQELINETDYWFLNFTSYDYPGWQSMTWTQGITLLVEGKVAFEENVNSWVNYAYDFLNTSAYPPLPQYISNPSVVLIEEPFPGTQNYFALVIDSVGIPVGPQEQQALQAVHFWSSYQGQEIWTKWKAVTYYINATDYFNTPAQWYDYEQLINDSKYPQVFVYQLSDGGVFDDVFAEINSALLTLQEVGPAYLPTWHSTLASAMHEEESEWLEAEKLGLGYMGFPGHPFAGYYPPWATDPAAYGLGGK